MALFHLSVTQTKRSAGHMQLKPKLQTGRASL